MMLRSAAVVASLCLTLLLAAAPTGAQEVDRIAAVVNDEIISVQDVDMRARLALIMSKLPDTIDARRRVVPQVIRKMIDERLQMQEAGRLKISLTTAELDNAIANLERQNRMNKGQLIGQLQQTGIDPEAVRAQIRADVTWMKLSSRVLLPAVRIGEEEINDRLETIKSRQGLPEFLVSEIFLAVDSPRQDEEAHRLADRLLEQLRSGTPFPALAGQFSQSPTAASGGSMGWVAEGALEDELNAILARMQPGTISSPIRTANGYTILALADRRIAGAQTAADTTIELSQILFPVPPKDGPPRAVLVQKAADISRGARNCTELENLGKQINPQKSGRIGTVRPSDLPGPIRKAAADLAVNAVSAPVEIAEGILVLMVCNRETTVAKIEAPSRETVRRSIEDERVEMMARRYLRDLRRAAFVDVRM
jgi:peptidyl-prolyl cis-trans isomerase SurA